MYFARQRDERRSKLEAFAGKRLRLRPPLLSLSFSVLDKPVEAFSFFLGVSASLFPPSLLLPHSRSISVLLGLRLFVCSLFSCFCQPAVLIAHVQTFPHTTNSPTHTSTHPICMCSLASPLVPRGLHSFSPSLRSVVIVSGRSLVVAFAHFPLVFLCLSGGFFFLLFSLAFPGFSPRSPSVSLSAVSCCFLAYCPVLSCSLSRSLRFARSRVLFVPLASSLCLFLSVSLPESFSSSLNLFLYRCLSLSCCLSICLASSRFHLAVSISQPVLHHRPTRLCLSPSLHNSYSSASDCFFAFLLLDASPSAVRLFH